MNVVYAWNFNVIYAENGMAIKIGFCKDYIYARSHGNPKPPSEIKTSPTAPHFHYVAAASMAKSQHFLVVCPDGFHSPHRLLRCCCNIDQLDGGCGSVGVRRPSEEQLAAGPDSVKSYTLTPAGKLDVTLSGTECTVAIQNYKLQFAGTLTGAIQPGSIRELHGLSLNVKYACLVINRIDHVGNQMQLYVQNINTVSLPVSSFARSPSC